MTAPFLVPLPLLSPPLFSGTNHPALIFGLSSKSNALQKKVRCLQLPPDLLYTALVPSPHQPRRLSRVYNITDRGCIYNYPRMDIFCRPNEVGAAVIFYFFLGRQATAVARSCVLFLLLATRTHFIMLPYDTRFATTIPATFFNPF